MLGLLFIYKETALKMAGLVIKNYKIRMKSII